MTVQRRDNHGTELGNWFRQQPELDSKLGYRITDFDHNVNLPDGRYYFIEEKRYLHEPKPWQLHIFQREYKLHSPDPNFISWIIVKFERSSPYDGRIWIQTLPQCFYVEYTKNEWLRLMIGEKFKAKAYDETYSKRKKELDEFDIMDY